MSLLLRQLWYGGLLLPPVVQDDNPTPPGPDPVGKHIIGLASGVRNGKLLIATQPTRCEETQIGDVYLGLVSGVRDEKPLLAVVDQRCGEDVALEQGQTYLGLVSGVRDDKPLLVVPCSPCNDDPDGPPIAPSPCCARLLPATLSGRILSTISHDTELNFYYNPAFLRGGFGSSPPGWIPIEAIPDGNYAAAWWSDLIEDYSGSVSLSGTLYVRHNFYPFFPDIEVPFTVVYDFSVYYYVVVGLDFANRSTVQCAGTIVQVCYPVGNWYYDETQFNNAKINGNIPLPAPNPEPIDFLSNNGLPSEIRARFGLGSPAAYRAVTGAASFVGCTNVCTAVRELRQALTTNRLATIVATHGSNAIAGGTHLNILRVTMSGYVDEPLGLCSNLPPVGNPPRLDVDASG